MASMRRTAETCDVLLRRIANPRDPLNDLARHSEALNMPDAGNALYERARRLFWSGQYPRAVAVFTLLTHPANQSDFVKGNAYYFLGKALRTHYHDNVGAFTNYLYAQHYSACLVFIAFSYLEAAKTLQAMGQVQNALGLLAVDVPCIDYNDVYADRHWTAARMWLERNNVPRAMRHFQAAYAMTPACSNDLSELFSGFPQYFHAQWQAVGTNPLDRAEADDAIITALTNACSTPDDKLFMEALLHEWPATSAIPLAIATNRVLNNNIFPNVRKSLPQSISKHIRGAQ
jgi:tetratricopeptide (TPR) repeat protein